MSTPEIRTQVSELIKTHVSTTPKLRAMTSAEVENCIFRRTNNIRLTYSGMAALSKIANCYTFALDSPLKAKHIMALSEFKSPYYLSDKYLVLFSEEDALMLKLGGSDIHQYLEKLNTFR